MNYSSLTQHEALTTPPTGTKRPFWSLPFLLFAILFVRVPEAHAIAGGGTANFLKGQVQLLKVADGVVSYVCTGSLIDSQWVLTAKHCITSPPYITIATGQVFAGDLRVGAGPAQSGLAAIALNPNYDVALLRLSTPVTLPGMVVAYGTGIPPVRTATSQGAFLFLQAWGGTTIGSGIPAAVLQTSDQEVTQYANGILTYSPASPLPGIPQLGDSGAGDFYYAAVCAVHSGGDNRTYGTGTATDAVAGWIEATSGIAPVPDRPDGSRPCEHPRQEFTCDIYDDSGSQCVGAFSTTRPLYNSGIRPKLYQITRDLDGAALDILEALSRGYADSAAQDAFCANTNCTITKIYDQSPYGNDLTIEQGGEAKRSADSGAVANALPIMLNGHKVYGLSVTPGVGYRNDNTLGVSRNVGPAPVNKTPEGMYMVTSGKNVNGACCFDFGNAETDNQDNHEGHMDALNFGTFCGFPPCNGSGPWVEADLENGQYMGGGKNPSNTANISLPYNFVTAMLKNDSQSIFALKGGNAQSGGLTALYDGSLPTQKPGYVPMQLEGAIVLGTGGDNSAGGIGSFFEGAMTTGYPSDATEAAVQENIVAAGYSGNSVPTNGEPPSYTGPSDPNGPGPQDGLESPADEQPNDLMGTRPGMAFHNGQIYAAFQSNDSRHELYVTATTNGLPYPTATGYPGIHIGSAPAVAEFKHELFVAFQADDSSHQLFVTESPSGTDFPVATPSPKVLIGSAPAMAAFRHELFVAFQANDASHNLFITSSPDGHTFPAATQVPNVKIGSAPAMAVFRSQLYVAFRANDPSNDVWIASSSDGIHFSSQVLPGLHMGPNSSPALVVSNNILYYIYGAADLANEMLVVSSTDGSTWQGPHAYLGVQMGATGPGASVTNDGFTVGFQSNDSRNVLFTSYKHTEPLSYTGPDNTGGPQDGFAPSDVEQTLDFMGSKPAFAGYIYNILVAFQANDATDDLFVASTVLGQNYPTATAFPNIKLGSAPAIIGAQLGSSSQVFMAFQADDASDDLFVTASSDGGQTWPAAKQIPAVKIGGAPALAYFKNKLYLTFQADDPSHNLFVTSSSDGQNWPAGTRIPNVKIGSDPAMDVFNGKLYVAFRADDPSDDVWIASSSDGVNFQSQVLPGQMGGSSSPALVATGDALYYICEADDLGNEMLVYASTDGSTWQGPEVYSGLQMGITGPGAALYHVRGSNVGAGVTVGFQSNDSRNVLFTTTKTTTPNN